MIKILIINNRNELVPFSFHRACMYVSDDHAASCCCDVYVDCDRQKEECVDRTIEDDLYQVRSIY